MLVITVALSIIILGIALNQFNIEGVNFSNSAQAANIMIKQDLTITHVYYNTAAKKLGIIVFNIGSVGIYVVNFGIYNITKCSSNYICSVSNSTPVQISPNSTITLIINVGGNGLDPNAIYSITITTQVYIGTQPTGYFKQYTTSYSYSTNQIIQ